MVLSYYEKIALKRRDTSAHVTLSTFFMSIDHTLLLQNSDFILNCKLLEGS